MPIAPRVRCSPKFIQSSPELTLQEQPHKLTERQHRAVQRRRVCATTAVATQHRTILSTTDIDAAAAMWLLPLHEALPPPPHAAQHAQEAVFVGVVEVCGGLLLMLMLMLTTIIPGVF